MNKSKFKKACLIGLSFACLPVAFAAKPIDLNYQHMSLLSSFAKPSVGFTELSRRTGPGNKLHVQIQQTYAGLPVYGAQATMHIANAKNVLKSMDVLSMAKKYQGEMNGTLYQSLNIDLPKAPSSLFTETAANKASQAAIDLYQSKIGTKLPIRNIEKSLVVYVDDANKAHYAYKVSFAVDPINESMSPSNPVFILDAITLQLYKQSDDAPSLATDNASSFRIDTSFVDNATFNLNTKTQRNLELVSGGGFGGNGKVGKLIYDGLPGHLASFIVSRDPGTGTCYLVNNDVYVKYNATQTLMNYPCVAPDPTHDNVYWSASFDAANGAFSPANDVMYNSQLMKNMLESWYHLPVAVDQNNQPRLIYIHVHYNMATVVYSNASYSVGDGMAGFLYPLSSRDYTGFGLSFGITERHAIQTQDIQRRAVAVAFGVMSAKALEYYATGSNSWVFADDATKQANNPVLYIDQPTRDCKGGAPGKNCSIDNMSQYSSALNYYQMAGVLDRMFYLITTSNGWNIKKTYDVLVNANLNYWNNSNFSDAACGILKSTKDLGYEIGTVQSAISSVGIVLPSNCFA